MWHRWSRHTGIITLTQVMMGKAMATGLPLQIATETASAAFFTHVKFPVTSVRLHSDSSCNCKNSGTLSSSSGRVSAQIGGNVAKGLVDARMLRCYTSAALPEHLSDVESTVGSSKKIRGKKELPPEEAEYQQLVEQELAAEAHQKEVYRQMSARAAQQLEGYAVEDIKEAKRTVAKLVMAEEKVEEMIAELAEEGKLTDVLLQVIHNRLDLARHDDEREVIQCLDLLYRRIETERRARAASPSLRLLNELLHLHDGGSEKAWLRRARQRMEDAFVPEDPSLVFFQPGSADSLPTMDESELGEAAAEKGALYRIDFISELDELLSQVAATLPAELPPGQDPASVAARLQQMERIRAVDQVRQLRNLAIELRW